MKTLPTPKVIRDLPPKLTSEDRVAMDVELFKMDEKRLHRPSGKFASLMATVDGEVAYACYDQNQLQDFLDCCMDAVWIFHNASFDLRHLRRWAKIEPRKKLWDTMVIERIMWNNYYDAFALNDLARRYLDAYLPKETRQDFAELEVMTSEMEIYAANDVIATWRIYQAQHEIIDENDLNIWKKIDRPALWCILDFKGAKIDSERWLQLAAENKAKADEIRGGMDINPGSVKQVKHRLHQEGIKLESTGKKILESVKDESELAGQVLDYRTYAKRASTYGEKWIKDNLEADGRVYSSYNVVGAETGRLSSSSPNCQNIPIRDTPEYRKCFIAGEGNVLVVADWSSQEPRIAAFLSEDEKLIGIFKSGKDVYIEIAREIFGETITKKDPRRYKIKILVLGISYGLTPKGMSQNEHWPEDECEELFDRFAHAFPDFTAYQRRQAKVRPFVQTIYGRRCWINSYSYQADRNAQNSPIQGSAADAMKIAMVRFCEEWGANPIVFSVHDELGLEVTEIAADDAKERLERIMIDVAEEMHPGIPANVEVNVGKNWFEAKGK